MIFNSIPFIFVFMPVVMVGFWICGMSRPDVTKLWLVLASLCFYAYWRLDFLPVLLASMSINYVLGVSILATAGRWILPSALLAGGVAANLLALVYFKYAAALAAWFGFATVAGTPLDAIILPLGVSFFTFTQIAYLIDARLGTGGTRNPLDYGLFVTFFPHLIAGPILHHREMMPQFRDPATSQFVSGNLAVGLTLFCAGLAKKVLLADPLAADVAVGFGQASTVGTGQAWASVIAYSLQLYFDFSGYSDMAIGLARMFNIRFPLNFNSPLKATSIVDFWQRWHMTLTRFITQYIYNPISIYVVRRLPEGSLGTRSLGGFVGALAVPTITAMALAGIWHGAGLQYLVFGLLHGFYIVINHAARAVLPKPKRGVRRPWVLRLPLHVAKVLLVYLCALVAWLFFRSPSVDAALDMLGAMIGTHGAGAGPGGVIVLHLAALLAFVWSLPNTQEILAAAQPALGKIAASGPGFLAWRPSLGWAAACGVVAALAVLSLGNATEFLYFQF